MTLSRLEEKREELLQQIAYTTVALCDEDDAERLASRVQALRMYAASFLNELIINELTYGRFA
jgi:hypothetical protein